MSWKKQYREQLEDRDDSPFYRLENGTNVFRPLPHFNWEMSDDPGEWPTVVEYLKHKNVGPKERLVACGYSVDAEGNMTGECWLCDVVIPKYAQSASEKERKRADDMKPVPFSVMQVSPVKNGKFQPPKQLEIQVGGDRSWGGKLMNYLLREDRFYEHPLKGKNFVVVKKVDTAKKGPSGTSYPIVEVEEEVTKVPKSIFDMRKPFEDLLPVYDPMEQKAAIKGEDYQRNRQSDGWNAPDADTNGYDESGGDGSEGWGTEAAAGDGSEGWGEEAGAEGAEGWSEEGYEAGAEGWDESTQTDGEYPAESDGAGWGESEGVAETEEWGAEGQAEGADSWDETPVAAPPIKKGPPVKKGPPPPPVKKGPPPVKKGPAPPVKKGPPPPPVKKAGPYPVKKGPPPPPVKKGPAPPVKKGPPPVKKGMPPRR